MSGWWRSVRTSAASVTETLLREAPLDQPPPRLELPGWRSAFGVIAGITARGPFDQPFDLGLAGRAPAGEVLPRWHAVLAAASPCRAMVAARQVHGTRVITHTSHPAEGVGFADGADGHVTRLPGLLLGVTLADCLPVYLVDPVARVIGLLHAGWRGVAGGILAEGLAAMQRLGATPAEVQIHLGVGICGECYEVGSEVLTACGRPNGDGRPGSLDLRSVLAEQAGAAGVAAVSRSPWCAAHDHDRFFSHRASGGAEGRMVAYLGLVS